jgi:hypothetical protein
VLRLVILPANSTVRPVSTASGSKRHSESELTAGATLATARGTADTPKDAEDKKSEQAEKQTRAGESACSWEARTIKLNY